MAHTPNPVTLLDGLRAALDGAVVAHSDDDTSVAADADVAVVVVGYTKDDEGEYLGSGDDSPFLELAPPMDHPELGFTDPAQAESLGVLFSGETGEEAVSIGGDRSSLRLHPADEQLIARHGRSTTT